MATIIPFVPSAILAPTFQVTLDGQVYTGVVTWNLFAQRFYLTIVDLGGSKIFTRALVGSPVGRPVSGLSWSKGQVTVSLPEHRFRVGSVVRITITDAVPNAYDGEVNAFVATRDTLTFPLASDPGAETTLGTVQQNLSLTAGYFASSMVYRQANRVFEVS